MVLADDVLWIELEKEPIANLALSPEESEVLESARHSSNPFPLFINGRAGSGKSTILQYLFADLLFTYLSKADARGIAPPIYLTANSELLRVAPNFVERLLKSEATLAQPSDEDMDADRSAILDRSFREFYGHMLSLIPAGDRKSRFARAADACCAGSTEAADSRGDGREWGGADEATRGELRIQIARGSSAPRRALRFRRTALRTSRAKPASIPVGQGRLVRSG